MDKKNLLDSIEKHYGFKRELIQNPELCGCWFVQFEVNGIKYCGSIPFHGALPQLKVTGYTTKHYNEHGTPVEDWYYNEFINGKQARLLHCVDADAGDWEDTGIRFENQKEAEEYMYLLKEKKRNWAEKYLTEEYLSDYQYEMIQEVD